MFRHALVITLALFSTLNIVCEACCFESPDVATEADIASVVLQGMALNNTTFNVLEYSDSFDFETAVEFSVVRILKGWKRMPTIQRVAISSAAIHSQGCCMSADNYGSKYLIFLSNVSFLLQHNFSTELVPVLKPENLNLIVVSTKKSMHLVLCGNSKMKRQSFPTAALIQPEVNISRGTKIRLVCHTTGYPVPDVKWFKNKVTLFSDVHIHINNKRCESKLVISKAESSDTGVYECQASNCLGESKRALSTVHVIAVNGYYRKHYGVQCRDHTFCLNRGHCFYYPLLRHRFCVCSSMFTGSQCEVLKNGRTQVQSFRTTHLDIFLSDFEIVIVIVAIAILISLSLLFIIANLASKISQFRSNRMSCLIDKSQQDFPQPHTASQVEITNLIFTEHTVSSEPNSSHYADKQSLDGSVCLSPNDAFFKSKIEAISVSNLNESVKSVPLALEENCASCAAEHVTFDSDNFKDRNWLMSERDELSDLEVHQESDVDMMEVGAYGGDELYCLSCGLSEMSSRCDGDTSDSVDCNSTSSANLSQRLLRHLFAYPQMDELKVDDDDKDNVSLNQFLGQHCIAMRVLPDLKNYLGMLDIDNSVTGSYPQSFKESFTTEL